MITLREELFKISSLLLLLLFDIVPALMPSISQRNASACNGNADIQIKKDPGAEAIPLKYQGDHRLEANEQEMSLQPTIPADPS